jgi:quaternary ammonium compound-resistance protein SugE
LAKAEGFTRLAPTLVLPVAIGAAWPAFAYATRTLPAGTTYAVWVGIRASLIVAYGMWTGDEPISIAKVLLLCALIATIIGLKLAR